MSKPPDPLGKGAPPPPTRNRLRIVLIDEKHYVEQDIPRSLAEDSSAMAAFIKERLLPRLDDDPDFVRVEEPHD